MDLMARLAACGLYHLQPDGMVARETAAMQVGLSLLAERLDAVKALRDPAQMPEETLLRYAHLTGLNIPKQRAALPLREAVARMIQLPWPRTAAEMEAFFAALGANLRVVERANGKGIVIEGEAGGFLPDAQAIEAACRGLVPVGQQASASLGELTWEMIDRSEVACAALDAADFTWAWFDLFGHQLFASLNRKGEEHVCQAPTTQSILG